MELCGGLGNQMFQYAHGLALSKRFGIPLRLSFCDPGRSFGLGIFGLTLDEDLPGPAERIEYYGDYQENQEWPTAVALASSSGSRARLAGYFQNEGFFHPSADDVRRCFRLPSLVVPNASERTLVGVHVRRGDFVGSELHQVCSIDYYRTAMRMMRLMLDSPMFLILSDDPDWCEATLAMEEARVLPKGTEADALKTMLACQAFILSNSTFGWWGAWLAGTGPIVAPDRFLNGQQWNICPPRWISIGPEGLSESWSGCRA